MPLVQHSFTAEYVNATIERWNVYASPDPLVRGDLVAWVSADDRSAAFELPEGTWTIRTSWQAKDGGEQDWHDAYSYVLSLTLRDTAPPDAATSAPAVLQVEPSMEARLVQTPPTRNSSEPYYTQVIEGPDVWRGFLLYESLRSSAESGLGPLMPDASRLPSAGFPMESNGNATRDVWVRQMSMGGLPGPAVKRTIAVPARDKFHSVPIALVSGATHTGFAAPIGTDGWEYDAADGLRLLTFPVGMTGANWTIVWGKNRYASQWVDNATVESDEIDLGVDGLFILEVRHQFQRKTSTGCFGTLMASDHAFRCSPQDDDAIRRLGPGPAWAARETMGGGQPRQPLRPQDVQFQYVVGSAPGMAHASSDYLPHAPGAWLTGRYVRVRVVIVEPTSCYQVICPAMAINALMSRVLAHGSGSPEAALAGPPGSVRTRDDGPPYVYVKASGVGNTGWQGMMPYAAPLFLTPDISPTQLTASVNDYAPTGFATAFSIRLTANASWNITGLAGGAAGRVVAIFNVDAANNITLKNEDAASAAGNRFAIGSDITLVPGASALLRYDSASSRWRAM